MSTLSPEVPVAGPVRWYVLEAPHLIQAGLRTKGFSRHPRALPPRAFREPGNHRQCCWCRTGVQRVEKQLWGSCGNQGPGFHELSSYSLLGSLLASSFN